MYRKIVGYGYGKIILFGEHFVVYNLPAVVSSLNCKTLAFIEKNKDYSKEMFELLDFRPKSPFFKISLKNEYKNLVKNILDFYKLNERIKIVLSGNLIVFSGGIGSSAACSAAISRAVNNFLNLKLNDEMINKAAFHGEKAVHGNPSGIDNTAAVYGDTFLFEKCKNQETNIIKKIKIKKSIEIVLVDSGVASNTNMILKEVKNFKEKNKDKFKLIICDYSNLIEQAIDALINFDLKKVGLLMYQNHELLKQINVSCEKLNEMVQIAKRAGAFGAKLTGTGKGGIIVALTPGKVLQENVNNEFQKLGYFTFKTTIYL